MTFIPRRLSGLVILGVAAAATAFAQSEPFTLTSPTGAVVQFSEGATGWRWTSLAAPGAPEGGWTVAEEGAEIEISNTAVTLNRGWELVEQQADRVVLEQDAAGAGVRLRRVFSFGPSNNTLRIETWARTPGPREVLARIRLLDVRVEGETFRETGGAPASFPVFGERLFLGIEHVSGEAAVLGELADRAQLAQRPRRSLGGEWQPVATVIAGWVQPAAAIGLSGEARVRQSFLQYLDTVRVKPERIVLHSETWWTLPPPLTEKNVLADIESLKKAFLDRTGMFFDTYTLDLGWSDPKTFWRIDPNRFPNEFRAVHERLGALGAQLGLWMSPGSGYAEGLNNGWLQSQGYEMTPFGDFESGVACFALGTRYQREFKERLLAYARQYGMGHVILDFMAQRCDVPTHGHPIGDESRYAIDAGVADVLDGLRAINPNIALEPMVCGYPPSPWWLMKTPFILGPAGDDMPYGRVPCPDWMESLISSRDIAYRGGQSAWIMPTQALETWDIIVQTPGEFENVAAMAIGRGRWFISSYIKPELMRPEDWDFFAALIRWARANKQFLVNAWQFGGQPENREAYGFLYRNAAKDIYCVRNPWIEERSIELPASGLAAEPRDVRMIYPRRAIVGRLEPGQSSLKLAVAPYETVFLETVPAADAAPAASAHPQPIVEVVQAAAPRLLAGPVTATPTDKNGIRYYWDGALSVPDVLEGELCILVEGSPEVARAACKILLGGREAKARKSTSVGQFAAASDASPENWTWFIAPLPPGDTTFQIDLSVLMEEASIGVFVRGFTPAGNDPAPDEAAVFPTFRADRRAWSQTLQPVRPFTADTR